METKTQTFEVVLYTTDEEVDGENLIDNAVREYCKANKKEHIDNVSVESIRSEYDN